jgi:molybdenum cofactor cytidylyltransferase
MTNTPSFKSKVAGIILAAGQSKRMGKVNKLLTEYKGKTFIRRVADSALSANLDEVIVVIGNDADRIKAELSGLSVTFVHNQNFAEGISSSLKAGVEALGSDIDAALVMLADMPLITKDTVRKIVSSYCCEPQSRIIIPYCKGQRGNPVLWPRNYFRELASLSGDRGARQLFKVYAQAIHKVELGEEVLLDIDTPTSAAALTAKRESL